MNKKPGDTELGVQPCLSADYLRSYPVDCSRQFIHVIKPGEITFAGQGGLDISGSRETVSLGSFVLHNRDIDDRGGKPSSRVRVREEAMRRLCMGRYPETLKEFSEQLSAWLAHLGEMSIEEIPQMIGITVQRNTNDLWNAWHSCRGCRPTPWR